MITSNNEKLEAIVKHFNIGSFEKGIEKMHNIMAHVLQEKCDSDEVQIIKYNTIVDEVYQRLQSENYKKPNVACKHFAYLGQKIGEYFGKEVGIIHCHPKHIANGNHYMLDDGEKYYDPSAYNAIFFSGKWMNVKETGIKLTDIPKEFIDKEANFIFV
jgi:glutamate racemase